MWYSHFYKIIAGLALSFPFYYSSKYVEKIIKPRESGWQFLLWVLLVLALAYVYFYATVQLYLQFFHKPDLPK